METGRLKVKALYQYRGTLKEHEDITEEGVLKAASESDARAILIAQGFSDIHLKQVRGLSRLLRLVRRP